MKKLVGIFMTILLTLMSFNFTFASESYESPKTLADVQAELNNYIEEKYDFKVGSEDYAEYLLDVLMFDKDEELTLKEDYADIRFFASIFLSELDNSENVILTNDGNTDVAILSSSVTNQTLDSLKERIKLQEKEDAEIAVSGISPFAAYSPTAAANYGYTYGEDYNVPAFQRRSILVGGDCTNFVSQCVKAGGKSYVKPSSYSGLPNDYENNNYWYSYRFLNDYGAYNYKHSTSFIRVKDFYTYWKNHGATVISCSSVSALQSKAKLGDIVQLKDSDGDWYHSVIISRGSSGNWKYAGHTNDRKAEPLSSLAEATSFRIIRL